MLFFFLKIMIIYLFIFLAASCLSCNMQDLSLRHAGSFVVARGLFVVVRGFLSSCGMQVFSSLVVACRLQGARALVVVVRGLCSLRHVGSS